MLSTKDYNIAIFVINHMKQMCVEGIFNSRQFDAELKAYINALLEKGLEVSQMESLFKAVGMDMEIHVHEILE